MWYGQEEIFQSRPRDNCDASLRGRDEKGSSHEHECDMYGQAALIYIADNDKFTLYICEAGTFSEKKKKNNNKIN